MWMKIAFFAAALLLSTKVFPQTGLHDSSTAGSALQSAVSLYYHVTGENIHLNKGTEYPGYDVNLIGNPYFDTTAMLPGWIYYDGTLYSNVPMLFDVYEDVIVINRYEKNYKIRKKSTLSHFCRTRLSGSCPIAMAARLQESVSTTGCITVNLRSI
jgi:hypothetical protein